MVRPRVNYRKRNSDKIFIVSSVNLCFERRFHFFRRGYPGQALFIQLILKGVENLVFDFFPEVIGDWVGKVLEGSVFSSSARHRDKVPLRTVDYLQPSNDEGIIEGNTREGLELFLVFKGDADFGDFHRTPPREKW